MKKIFRSTIPIFLALTTAFVLTACNQQTKQGEENVTSEDVKSEMKEAAGTTNEYLSQEQQEMVDNYQQKLDQIEGEIETFKDKMESAKASVADEYQASVDTLESRYATLEDELKDLQNSTEDAWSATKEGVDDALSDLEESLKNAREKFNDES